jgi:hypothetical protein
MLKRTVVRLLLFGIPFGLSYWASRPEPQAGGHAVVVCASPGDRPGELRISLNTAGCAQPDAANDAGPAAIIPAGRIVSEDLDNHARQEPLSIPF